MSTTLKGENFSHTPTESSTRTTQAGTTHETMSDSPFKDTTTLIMGGIVGGMLLLTIGLCIKTRIVKKRDKRVVEYGDNLRDHLENVNIVHVRQPSYENETNEMRENQSRDHENYALVEPSEKCYEDLPPGEYDLLRSQRKHKVCLSGSCEEPNYDQVHKGGGMYDIAGQVHTEVLQSDYEYEMIKNMKKTNTLNKESGISNKHGYTENEEAMQIRS
ncbi:uncharacterized protein LOC111113592 isoform X2 [Crassostrea virginica]